MMGQRLQHFLLRSSTSILNRRRCYISPSIASNTTTDRLIQSFGTTTTTPTTTTTSNSRYQQQHSFSTTTATSTATDDVESLLGVGKYKTSTGLVGLAVEPDWYNVMLAKFQALLDKMEASDMPETAQYRMDVTKWCNYVIATVKANPESPEAVEDAIQMGQVEELIEMANDEMICLDTYLSSRMWEMVADMNPPVIDLNPDPMRDPFGADGNTQEQDSIRKGMEPKTK